MSFLRRGLPLFLLLISCVKLWSQADPDFSKTGIIRPDLLYRNYLGIQRLDTSLDDFHLYHPAFLRNFGLMDLGNSGTAVYPVRFGLENSPGFDHGWHYLDPYLFFENRQSNYYDVRQPLTNLFYTQGANELIHLDALHTQNVRENWNVGIEYRRHKEDGNYLRQKASIYNTRLFSRYNGPGGRYTQLVSATFNRIVNQENGGVVSKDAFDTLDGPVRTAPVRYYNASDPDLVLNRLRSNHFQITQFYRLGPQVYLPTKVLDSLGKPIPDTIPTQVSGAQLSLKTEYQSYQNLFVVKDLNGLGFDKFYLDSVATFDSLRWQDFHVQAGIQSGPYVLVPGDSLIIRERPWFAEAYISYHAMRIGWLTDYAAYNQIEVSGAISSNPFRSGASDFWKVNGWHALTGYNSGDYLLEGYYRKRWKGKLEAGASGRLQRKEADFNQYYYFGNHHFWWNKNLNKQEYRRFSVFAGGNQSWLQPRLEYSLSTLDNHIVWASDATPMQVNSRITVQQVDLSWKFRWKWLNWQTQFLWQSSSLPAFLPLPQWAGRQSIFAEGHLFGQNLYAKLGADIFFTTAYQAPVYEAPIREFRLQRNGENFNVGNYPWVNVFFSGRIRTVTFYVMFQHLNMGWGRTDFYSSPYYPMQPRALRFGIQWRLYQ